MRALVQSPKATSPSVALSRTPVNRPGDAHEQAADRAADHVLHMPAPTWSGHAQPLTPPQASGAGVPSQGQPLDPVTRAFMEPRFGHNFANVRVHSGADAARSARDLAANAYTVGPHIVFGAHRFSPSTHAGQRLIAHELAHVVQQTQALSPPMVQRDDTVADDPWTRLSPSAHTEAQELWDDCDASISALDEAQMVRQSMTRTSWLDTLRGHRAAIEAADSDAKLAAIKKAYSAFDRQMNGAMKTYRAEWGALADRYRDEHRWLLSISVKSTDSTEAAKYLESLYQLTAPSIPFLVADDDYAELKNALDKKEYIRIGALRGTRIRTRQLLQMMRTVADLRRKGEDAEKFIPEWSERVAEEAEYLDSFAALAREAGREYAAELADLRKQLLDEREATLKIKAPTKSVLEKGVALVTGAVEAVAGIFIEAAKEVVDLVQIGLHFLTFRRYEPKFISDMAKAAEEGKSTTELLMGMVTGIVKTPERFLQACRDGDWEAIGRESVNLYFLAKTIRAAPELIKGSAEALRRLPDALARTFDSLTILRQRTVALGLKTEGRFRPEPTRPAPPPTPPPTTTPTLTVKPGGGQGSRTPTGMLRDVDSPSRGVQVDASHPVFKRRMPANDPPPPAPRGQAQKVAVNGPQDVPPGQVVKTTQPPSPTGDTTTMSRRLPRSRPKAPSEPPAGKLDIDEGEIGRKRQRGEEPPKKETISTPDKVPIRGSAWLNRRLSADPALQDAFMKWVEKEHFGAHEHMTPETTFADDLLERWNDTLTQKRTLGERRSRPARPER